MKLVGFCGRIWYDAEILDQMEILGISFRQPASKSDNY